MPPRPTRNAVVTFGLVSIPIRLYTAVSEKSIGFNMLHEKCRSRVKQHYRCPTCDEEVARTELVKGYEFAKDQYVVMGEDELDALEKAASPAIQIVQFVPLTSVDPTYYARSQYLGPDKGGDRPYRLLVEALKRSGRAAIAKTVSHGKEHVVLIRPNEDGLVLHDLYRAEEVRGVGEVPKGNPGEVAANEIDLALMLVQHLAKDSFDPKEFPDTYRERLEKLIEEKVKGEEVVVAPAAEPRAQIIDIMEALKRSLAETNPEAVGGAADGEGDGKRRQAAAAEKEEEGEEEESETAATAPKKGRRKKAG